MKTTELIKMLEKDVERNGNREVVILNPDTGEIRYIDGRDYNNCDHSTLFLANIDYSTHLEVMKIKEMIGIGLV